MAGSDADWRVVAHALGADDLAAGDERRPADRGLPVHEPGPLGGLPPAAGCGECQVPCAVDCAGDGEKSCPEPDPPAAPYRLLGVRAHRGITGTQLLTITVECADPSGGLLVQPLPDRLVIGGGRLLTEYAASGALGRDLARLREARSQP